MLAARLREDLVHLGNVRCRGGRDALRERRRFETAVAQVTPADFGLPPRALLFVRRVAPAVPLGIAGQNRTFADAVRAELSRRLRNAGRPWLRIDGAAPDAVLFLDEAELAACLIRDWLQRSWGAHWWWRELLGSLSVAEWLQRHVVVRADVLAPAMELLAAHGLAPAWCCSLQSAWIGQAAVAIEASYGVSAQAIFNPVSRGMRAPETRIFDDHAERAEHISTSRSLKALLRIVPEVAARGLSAEQRGLLAVTLAIRRDLRWAQSSEFAEELLALREGEIANPQLNAHRKLQEGPDGLSALQLRGEPAPSQEIVAGSPLQPAQAVVDSESPVDVSNLTIDVAQCPPGEAAPFMQANTDFHALNQSRAPPEIATRFPMTQSELHSTPGGDAGLDKSDGEATGGPVQRPPPVESKLSEVDSNSPTELPASVSTMFGGVFYLLNVALALGLYGDFSMPRHKGLDLSPWDWLAMIGWRWFGDEFRKDPVWKLLAELAGHPPRRRPERGFKPPGRKSVERWFARMSAQLIDRLMQALGAEDAQAVPNQVCRHPAHIYKSATAVDVHLSLDDLPISLRICGLDRDPGWIPAAGRSIRFHFE